MRKIFTLFLLSLAITLAAQQSVTFPDIRHWTPSQLAPYVGQTIRLTQPWFVNQVSGGDSFYAGPHRLMAPTNQALPLSDEYKRIVSVNNAGLVSLSGLGSTPRMGEMLTNLVIKVNSTTSATIVGTPTRHFTYSEMNTPPSVGDCNLKVCCMNLCYFLVENLGSGSQGPTSVSQQNLQYAKILDAFRAIDADIYAVCEIEQGQGALEKLANGLTSALGRKFTYINDNMSASGTWTKSGYIYCSDRVDRVGSMNDINTGVANRKKLQAFRLKSNGEAFVLGVNHFKAKVGSGSGADADQGDGQGAFNFSRKAEAQAVIDALSKTQPDPDVLLMGDLNAYGMEDPVQLLVKAGFTDLHQTFHADTSYSYVYSYDNYTAGYLDHALANKTLLQQVTGMAAWHINSDEPYRNSYKYSSDNSKFRSSDHDPIIVGLRLGDYSAGDNAGNNAAQADKPQLRFDTASGQYKIENFKQGRVRIYGITGMLEYDEIMDESSLNSTINALPRGMHIINAYDGGSIMQDKIIIH